MGHIIINTNFLSSQLAKFDPEDNFIWFDGVQTLKENNKNLTYQQMADKGFQVLGASAG